MKRFFMEVKSIAEDGTFEGILSPYGNVDEGRDLVEAGAFKKTLKERGNLVPLLWQHIKELPIGQLELDDREDGLYCKGRLEMELQQAREAYVCLKAGIIKGLSIGYQTVKDAIESGVRHLKEIKLFEGSIVTFPMNESALVTAVKALSGVKGDFNQELAEIQTLDGFYQMRAALYNALASLLWSDQSRDDKISMCQTILEQFVDSFTAFFPMYIDALQEAYGPSETWSSKIPTETKNILSGLWSGKKDSQTLTVTGADSFTPADGAVEGEEPNSHSDGWVKDSLKGIQDLLAR